MAADQTSAIEMDLTVSRAAEWHGLLGEWLSEGGTALDLSAVAECDAAGVQLLCAAQRTAETLGRAFTLCNPGAAVVAALRTCGLDEQLRPLINSTH